MTGSAGRWWSWLRDRPRRVTAGVVSVVIVTCAVIFAVQAYRAASSLQQAATQAEQLQEHVVAGDSRAARVTLTGLRRSTGRAHDATDGWLWTVGAKLPWLGRNASAVRTIAATLDDVATRAMPPIVDVSDRLNVDAFSPRDGRIDLGTVQAIAPAVDAADKSLTAAQTRLDSIDPDRLVGRLRSPVTTLRDKVKTAQASASAANVATQLMPKMLGSSGKRTYLLLIQNNAEIRATGGIAGAFGVLTAEDGRLSMERTGSALDLRPLPTPAVPMTRDEKTVFTDQLVTDIRDVNVTPDFPRSGAIARAIVKERLGIDVDGVLSVDPVTLSHVLAATGKVEAGNGVVLDSTTAVDVLLNQVYRKYAVAQQDEVFAGTARKIFGAVTAGAANSRVLLESLSQSVAENRLMLWSRRPEEQRKLAPTGVAGGFAGKDDATPHVGVYLGDAAGSKMQYYLDYDTSVQATRCLVGGRQEITTTTTLVSTAPAGLPEYVTGNGKRAPKGSMRLFAWLYAPQGGRFTDIRLDGSPRSITVARLNGRPETTVEVRLKRGQTRTLSTTTITGPRQDGDGVFSTTPGVRTSANDVRVPSACY